MGYAGSDTRRLLIEQNREAISQVRDFLAGNRQKLTRPRRAVPVLHPPGERVRVRLRSGGTERGWSTGTRPVVGSLMELEGQTWTVISVIEICEHGYRVFARGCGTLRCDHEEIQPAQRRIPSYPAHWQADHLRSIPHHHRAGHLHRSGDEMIFRRKPEERAFLRHRVRHCADCGRKLKPRYRVVCRKCRKIRPVSDLPPSLL